MQKEAVVDLYNKFYELNRAPKKRGAPRNYLIMKYIFNHVPLKSTVLDVGCGSGHLIRALQTASFRAQGTEVSQWAIDNLLKDIQVQHVFMNDMSCFADNSFDCVICSDVLEHLFSEEEARTGVQELVRISKKHLIMTACNRKSKGKFLGDIKLPDNNTHTLQLSYDLWQTIFSDYFTVIESNMFGRSLCVYGTKKE